MKNKLIEQKAPFAHVLLLPVYILASILYLAWRIDTSYMWHTWYVYVFLSAEFYSILMTVLYLITSRRIMYPVWVPPLENKTVDVMIPTLNEPEHIVKMTAVGASYIKGVRHVFILDDGNRQNIREMAAKIGVKYLARNKHLHAKAGNMNFGIQYTDAEFLIFLDCDHVPQKNFLERTLGYFSDKKLAFVQTPQLFYNTDSIQFRKVVNRNYWNEQSMFYESIQPAKNSFNASFFCGSGAILRRSAIDSVGGFAIETATEDLHTSLRLHAKGWRSLFINEQLAYGLAPEDLAEFHKQRTRWGAGSIGLLFRSPDSPFVAKGLTAMQRMCYLSSASFFLNGIQKLFYFMMPIFILFSLPFNHIQTSIPVLTYLGVFLSFWGFSYFVTYIYSRGTFHPIYTEQFNIASILSSFFALKGILQIQKKFNVSTKIKVKKEKSVAYSMIIYIWVLMLVADLFGLVYWFIYKGNTVQSIFSTLIGISLFWNTLNFFFTWSFINSLIRYNKKPQKAHTFSPKHENLSIVYECNGVKSETEASIEAIDIFGANILSNQNIQTGKVEIILQSQTYKFNLPAQINLSSKLLNGKLLYHIVFDALSVYQETDLILFIFHKIVPNIFKKDSVYPLSKQAFVQGNKAKNQNSTFGFLLKNDRISFGS